jgi:hypothetical protein
MLEEKFFVEIWGGLCVISSQTPVIARTPMSVFTEFSNCSTKVSYGVSLSRQANPNPP